METAAFMDSTIVLLNMGAWFVRAEPGCADWTLDIQHTMTSRGNIDARITADLQTQCPSMRYICSLFSSKSFKLLYQTAPPHLLQRSRLKDAETIPPGHTMNVVERCQLSEKQMVDRSGTVLLLEPKRHNRHKLFLAGDVTHYGSEANHAFNAKLLDVLEQLQANG